LKLAGKTAVCEEFPFSISHDKQSIVVGKIFRCIMATRLNSFIIWLVLLFSNQMRYVFFNMAQQP